MRILLTNDDGIFSPALAAMARVLKKLGEVIVAAPASEQSGVGQSITFLMPVTIKRVCRDGEFWGYAVEGTPVDCVKIGVAELCGGRPDLIVSGMNNGLNAGANILYSGTVAAAREGAYLGITSVAVSLQYSEEPSDGHIEGGAEIALSLIKKILSNSESSGGLFNINIPFAAIDAPSGERRVAVVPMDRTPYWESYLRRTDPTGRRYYWLAGRPDYKKMISDDTDFGQVSHGVITITPLDFDPTGREQLERMKSWPLDVNDAARSDGQSESMNFRLYRVIDRS